MPYKTYTPRPGVGIENQTQQPVQNLHLQSSVQSTYQSKLHPQSQTEVMDQSQQVESLSHLQDMPDAKLQALMQSQPPLPPSDQPPLPSSDDVKMENAENVKRPPWFKKPGVMKLSKAVRKKRVNARLKRMLTPKNAMMVLNELKPGVKYNFVEGSQPAVHHAMFTASIDIDGKTYTGQGQSKGVAKQVAAENALRDIVSQKAIQTPISLTLRKEEEEEQQPPLQQEEEPKPRRQPMEEETPWGSLASFAIYKLFTEWQNQGYNLPPQLLGPIEASLPETGANGEKKQVCPTDDPGISPSTSFQSSIPTTFFDLMNNIEPDKGLAKGTAPHPTKKIPANPTEKHPVMLLNELRPGLQYQLVKEEGKLPSMVFTMGLEVDGVLYEGQGKSKKDAKKAAAVAALSAMYGIMY